MAFFCKKWSQLLSLVISILLVTSCAYADKSQYPDGNRKYIGTINENLNIHLSLEKKGTEMNGWYYYDSQMVKLVLRGDANGDSFYLQEYDEYGNNTGILTGSFTTGGTIEGYWLSPDGAIRFPFLASVLPTPEPGQVAKLYSSQPVSFEVNFSPDQHYIVSVEGRNKTTYGFPLKVYQDEKLVFEKTLIGDSGEIGLVDVRGSGRLDLVAVLSGGSGSYLNDFCIIGETGHGIGLLAGKELLKMEYTGTKVTTFSNKIGLEFNPAGAWPRYRVDVNWQPETESYVKSSEVRITPHLENPVAEKTVFFSLKAEDRKIRYFVGDDIITEVHISAGDKLLLQRDAGMDQELTLSYWDNYDKTVIGAEFVGGNFLITAKTPGTTKLTLFQPHNAPTGQELIIIVDP